MTPRKPYRRQCTAKNNRGEPCQRSPIIGGTVCATHGGRAPHVKAAAQRRAEQEKLDAEAARAARLWGGRRDVHPAVALLELVQWKSAEVEYWRGRVAELEEADLTWGESKWEHGTEKGERVDVTTEEPKPAAEYVMLRQAERDLADYAAASLRAGVDERMVQLAQTQAAQLLGVIRAVVADPRLAVPGGAPVDVVIGEKIKEITQ